MKNVKQGKKTEEKTNRLTNIDTDIYLNIQSIENTYKRNKVLVIVPLSLALFLTTQP